MRHLLKYCILVPLLHSLKVVSEAITVFFEFVADLHVRVVPLRELILFIVVYLCHELVPQVAEHEVLLVTFQMHR